MGAVTIAFTTITGQARLEQMRAWTRQELEASQEAPNIGARFRFTALPHSPTPEQAWLEPQWYLPFEGSQAHALLAP